MRMLYTPVCLAMLYIFFNTGFIFENYIKPTPYTIGTKYSPKLATSTIFVKRASIFLQIRHRYKPCLITSSSTIKSRFIHLLLVGGGGGVDPIPCMSTHRISDPRSGPAQLLPPHVKQRSHPHGVRPQIPDR